MANLLLQSKVLGVVAASEEGDPFDVKTDDLVTRALETLHVQGMAMAVINGDKIHSKGYGYADKESKIKVSSNTLFAAGSTTKSFTSAAYSLLVDSADYPSINWDSKIAAIIPEDFVLDDEYLTNHVTVKDALSHRTGFPAHGLVLPSTPVKQSTHNLRHLFTNNEIRTTWDYCNNMYLVVSHVIETLAKQNLGDFMKEKIWDPLEMKETFFSFVDAQKHVSEHEDIVLSKAYHYDPETQETVNMPYWNDAGISGAGSIISNVVDYAKWIKSFVNTSGPLSAASYQAVTSPVIPMPPAFPRVQGLSYGMGWMTGWYRGERIVFHPGGTDSFVANMLFLPERKFGVVGMVNASNSAVLSAPLFHLIDDFLGVPTGERADDGLTKSLEQAAGMKAYVDSMGAMLFPNPASPPISPVLPFSSYVGEYTHGAYEPITLTLEGDQLSGVLAGIRPTPFDLNHVSGEHFLVKPTVHFVPAQFRSEFVVSVEGIVEKFGVQWEGAGPSIWFIRKK